MNKSNEVLELLKEGFFSELMISLEQAKDDDVNIKDQDALAAYLKKNKWDKEYKYISDLSDREFKSLTLGDDLVTEGSKKFKFDYSVNLIKKGDKVFLDVWKGKPVDISSEFNGIDLDTIFDGSDELDDVDAVVSGEYYSGSPGKGPSMDHAGGEPAEESELEFESVAFTLGKHKFDLGGYLDNSQDFYDALSNASADRVKFNER
jgi:hypothetical protein